MTTSSPQQSPAYSHYRSVSVADSLPVTNKAEGANMSNYEYANIQVVPATGINPTVSVLWWSEGAGKFIQEHVALTKAGVGAGVPFEFSVPCYGRVLLVNVSVTTGLVDIYISGFSLHHPG